MHRFKLAINTPSVAAGVGAPTPKRNDSSRSLLARQDGIALIVVLMLVAVMLALGAFGARSAQIELRIAHNEMVAKQALDTAEAGLYHAYSVIQPVSVARYIGQTFTPELTNGGTGGALASLGSAATLNGTNYRFSAFGSGSGDGYYVRVVDNYDETGANDSTKDTDYRVYIVSQGSVSGAQRTIQALIKGTPLFPHALFGKQFVKMSGGSTVDSFDSSKGPYTAATAGTADVVRSNGNVTLNGSNTTIKGDAMAGGSVSGGSVTGTSTSNAAPITYPPVQACGPPYSSGTGITGATYNSATGALVCQAAAIVANGTYCFSSIKINSGGSLTVAGAVTMNVTGDIDLSGNGVVNTTNIPTNLQIYSSGSNVSITGGTNAAMLVYAPDAAAKLAGGSDFFGSIVALSIQDTGGTQIHYDTSPDILGPGAYIVNWFEVRGS